MDKSQISEFPLIVELNDLSKCLKQMGERPLKLIAERVCKEFGESEWDTPEWSFEQQNGIIEDKKILSNPDDTFQLSIANNKSKQEFHLHQKVFEIFVSNSKIKIFFVRNNKEETMEVANGVLIVPPGIMHKVELHGITFVFQSTVKGSKVHEDKQVAKN
jgi:hypothetical protein